LLLGFLASKIAPSTLRSEAGSYRFRLKSDDGSQLFIDNRLVVDNDGIHDVISKRGELELRSGRHRIRVWYFQGMKYQLALQLFVTPPGGAERLFSSSM
jgi:PA14 domain